MCVCGTKECVCTDACVDLARAHTINHRSLGSTPHTRLCVRRSVSTVYINLEVNVIDTDSLCWEQPTNSCKAAALPLWNVLFLPVALV